MSRGSAKKGAAGERELAGILQQYGYRIEREGTKTFGAVPDLIGLPGVHIEVKRVEKLNVPEAMKQAVRDSVWFRDGAPAVFHRRNREGWLVTMRLEDWVKMYGGKGNDEQGTALCGQGADGVEGRSGDDGRGIPESEGN